MICTHCGTAYSDHDIFCSHCGRSREPGESGPGSPLSGGQLWEAFGPGSLPDQQLFSVGVLPALVLQETPTEEQGPPPMSEVATKPLSTGTHNATRVIGSVATKHVSLRASITGIVVIVLILVALQVTGSDWAARAMHAAIGAGIITFLIVLGMGIRTLLGIRRRREFFTTGLSVLILLALCVGGLTQQSTIHSLQAHNWEGQQQWQSAINEFRLAGEGAPTSDNISRVYNEWGEQFSAIQHYQEAFAKFDIVLNKYSLARAEVARAQVDKITAYFAWAQQASQQHDYSAATMRLDAVLQLIYCDANCQSQANTLDATAYYNLAELQLSAQQYEAAVTSFQTALTRFASSPEAQKVHGDFAKALFGQGQQQLTTSCASAIPTYQQLSTKFADTPEGQRATTALKAPQRVKGRFIGSIPNDPSLTRVVALMKGLYANIPPDQLGVLLANSPQTRIANDGSFVFGPQPQGSYELAWGTMLIATGAGVLSWNTDRYVANVGPLCPYDFGDISENIPHP